MRSLLTRRPILALLALLATAGLVGWWAPGDDSVDPRDGTTRVDDQGMAELYGIKVTQVGVSAAGGIIDFRYQVVEPDKATPLIHDDELLPILVSQETGKVIGMTTPPHHHATDLELGGTYYFLMANTGEAIRKGDHVTVVVGDVRVEDIIAQG